MPRKEVKTQSVRWVHITHPEQEDMDDLREDFGFHPLDLSDSMSKTQRPKIDVYDDYVFMVLHFPTLNIRTRRVGIQEINLFIGSKMLVTITDQEHSVLEGMFSACQDDEDFRDRFMMKGPGALLYRILDPLFREIFSVVDKIGEYLTNLEREIYDEEQTVSSVKAIAGVQRAILRLRSTMDPQRAVIGHLVKLEHGFLGKESDVYFDDIHDHTERVSAFLGNHYEILNGLHQTNESLISHRTNEIIKTLTLISAALLPLTLITGVYGMNVAGLPYADEPYSFVLTILVLLIVLVTIVVFFRRKNWV